MQPALSPTRVRVRKCWPLAAVIHKQYRPTPTRSLPATNGSLVEADYAARRRRSNQTSVTMMAAISQIPSKVVPVGTVQKAR